MSTQEEKGPGIIQMKRVKMPIDDLRKYPVSGYERWKAALVEAC